MTVRPTVVLDSWALVAFLHGEPAAEKVRDMLSSDAVVSSINLGEVLYAFARSHGFDVALDRVASIRALTRVEDPDWALVEAAARLKVGGGMSFADAFCVATAERYGAPVATGDPEIIRLREVVDVIDLRAVR